MKLIECPRDAMQGIKDFIPTGDKIRYLNDLLAVGFDTLDFGSFVSPKAIPQMKDTLEVYRGLDLGASRTSLLAIVANARGADEAAALEGIRFIGFPLSISETFQQRNTNKSIAEALDELSAIQEICHARGKQLVVYISMGFGNPYGDPYEAALVSGFVDILQTLGVGIVSLADTLGVATAAEVSELYRTISVQFPGLELGLHLHSTPHDAEAKIAAAVEAGCKRMDGALRGYGGCPMATDELVGNIPTEQIIDFLSRKRESPQIDSAALGRALRVAAEIFPKR